MHAKHRSHISTVDRVLGVLTTTGCIAGASSTVYGPCLRPQSAVILEECSTSANTSVDVVLQATYFLAQGCHPWWWEEEAQFH
jgi:hypothetical protein